MKMLVDDHETEMASKKAYFLVLVERRVPVDAAFVVSPSPTLLFCLPDESFFAGDLLSSSSKSLSSFNVAARFLLGVAREAVALSALLGFS